jgi:hypothetical protein
MAFDILWWNATALEVLRRPQDFEGMSTGQYLDQKGYSAAFKDDYLTVRLYLLRLILKRIGSELALSSVTP